MKKFLKKLLKKELIINIEQVNQNQTYLYDDEFTYILHLYELFKMTQKIPGHIVEVGVAGGRNAIIFGQLIKHYGELNTKKYHGIDTFEGYSEVDLNKESYLSNDRWKDIDVEVVREKLNSLGLANICKLYKLDAYDITEKFIDKGGFQFQPKSIMISLLYIDCNSYGASKFSIEALMPYMSQGSIIAIDEKRLGGETKALKEVAEKHGLILEKSTYPSIYTFVKIK